MGVTWHEGILGNVGVLGEEWEEQKSDNTSHQANDTRTKCKVGNFIETPHGITV